MRRPLWADAAPVLLEELGLDSLTSRMAAEWSLVLTARRVPHRVRRGAAGFRLLVPRRCENKAIDELRAYFAENAERPVLPDLRPPLLLRELPGLVWSLGVVTVFLTMTGMESSLGAFRIAWHGRGEGNTALMASGQWWRALTALTLHADIAHLAGNVCLGGIFLLLLAAEVGLGNAWFLALAGGVAANAAKVPLGEAHYGFLGASTMVFAALGALAAVRLARLGRALRWRRIVPVAAGLMLLAFLGVGDKDDLGTIDLAGHFMGFGAGVVLGLLYAGLEGLTGKSLRGLSPWLGSAAALLFALAWGLALAA